MVASGVFAMALAALLLWLRPAPQRGASPIPVVSLGPVFFGLVIVLAWRLQSLVLPIAVLQVWALLVVMVRRTRRRKVDRLLDDELVMFVEDLSQQLRSGGSLVSSFLRTLARYPRVEERLEPAVAATVTGVRLEQALGDAAEHETSSGLSLLAASVSVLSSNGGPAATSLERLAQTLRDTASARDEAWAQASQALASGVVLAALPLLFAGGYAAIEPDVVEFYLRTPLGGFCLVAMLALITGAAVWIDLLIGAVR